jgi:hypothetical protein
MVSNADAAHTEYVRGGEDQQPRPVIPVKNTLMRHPMCTVPYQARENMS